ncbi:amidase [Siccirubricoccus sp. KC 17139]|uniref:Amidase n=1 Tax=Siccirubricoccus soli TaxID=2899147 RepID=A0ABT1D6W8_9PROT|nr:amidase [Siccirubricoccus soli]MCO6417684.1 amidase [Siccirubricoccus soli]MCP2683819.1 amidase [Siccirubricoccus soli]
MSGSYDPTGFRPLTFHDAVPGFRDGRDTPRAYLERCLGVIEAKEPVVRAWVTLNVEGARAAADAATARYREGRPLSPIDGMPIGIKDLILTQDMPTEMGSPLYKGYNPGTDSAAIQALRQAGAVILGKTVTTELGMSHPGPTTNPFHPAHTPGGSSSGSAAVIGAGMVPAAIGTQVVGSIIRPAGFCANHAIKPTYGALNRGERQGFSQSHFGVHAGSQRDMWQVAWEISQRAGGDPGHPGLFGEPLPRPPAKPQRLVLMESEGWKLLDSATLGGFETLLGRLRDAGVEILTRRDSPLIEAFEQAIGRSLEICRDVCGFEQRWTLENLAAKHREGLSDSIYSRLVLAREMTLDDYRAVLLQRELARRAFAAIGGLADGVISLSSVGPAPRADNQAKDSGITHTTGLPAFNAPSSVLGAPAITVPLMAVGGLPVGVQVMGQPHADAPLTGLAAWLAQHVPPVVVA